MCRRKRTIWPGALLPLFILMAALLSACGTPPPEGQIQVCVLDEPGMTVEGNGVWIEPGENAVFILRTDGSTAVTGAAYGGEYRLDYEDGAFRLELLEVRYPTRVCLETSRQFRRITYEANGGTPLDGTAQTLTLTYSTDVHTRPNTDQGTGLFCREGCTLTCWNTRPDGSGTRVGLGSRVSVPEEGLTLFAQWADWTAAKHFRYIVSDGAAVITGYTGDDALLVVPGELGGLPVKKIASGAFIAAAAEEVVLPPALEEVENGAFRLCSFQALTLFDDITSISDGAFISCPRFTTLHINAICPPWGFQYRRESLLADKVDLLIDARGSRKLVCYGGCSMWYNLDGTLAQERLGESYRVINMGLNGVVNSLLQMEIIGEFLEEGDVFFHTPELCSPQQLLLDTGMGEEDTKLWSGLEYNYDLVALADISAIDGVLDSFCQYLALKREGGSYQDEYRDTRGRSFLDDTGGIPFLRDQGLSNLGRDRILLDPTFLERGLPVLNHIYQQYRDEGVQVLVSCACVNLDQVPAEQRGNVERMDELLGKAVGEMTGVTLVSSLEDYIYHSEDMYDTNYHLLTPAAIRNTEHWLRDIRLYLG